MSYNTKPTFAGDFDIEKLTVLDKINRSSRGFSARVLYEGKVPLIKTPVMTVTFPLRSYDYGHGPKKYALCVTLNPVDDGCADLRDLCDTMDKLTASHMKDEYKEPVDKMTQYSAVHDKHERYPGYLRCKLVNNSKIFKCDVFENGKKIDPTIEVVEEKLLKGTKVQLHLQINPVWKVDEKFGISYQIKGINIMKERTEFQSKHLWR